MSLLFNTLSSFVTAFFQGASIFEFRGCSHCLTSLVAQMVKNLPAMQETDILSLGQEKGIADYPLQYSCLENPMDRGSRGAIVHRVTKSWTQLSN